MPRTNPVTPPTKPTTHRRILEPMRMTVLASGSKGNSTVIASSRTRVLVDAGLSCRELLKRMAQANEDPAQLDAILITHEHQDHVTGLSVLARRLNIPVFFTEPTPLRCKVPMLTPRTTMTYAQWLDHVQQEKLARAEAAAHATTEPGAPSMAVSSPWVGSDATPSDCGPLQLEAAAADEEDETTPAPQAPTFLPAVEYFQSGTNFSIGDISITPFTIPHDAADPCGFVFESEGIRMALATDLGYMPPNVKSALKRIDVLLLESNHDLEMLKDGPYPWAVKQRVLSRVGPALSNDACAPFPRPRLRQRSHSRIVLSRLSESNNAPGARPARRRTGHRRPHDPPQAAVSCWPQQSAPLTPICI